MEAAVKSCSAAFFMLTSAIKGRDRKRFSLPIQSLPRARIGEDCRKHLLGSVCLKATAQRFQLVCEADANPLIIQRSLFHP